MLMHWEIMTAVCVKIRLAASRNQEENSEENGEELACDATREMLHLSSLYMLKHRLGHLVVDHLSEEEQVKEDLL